ncbi:hypothetical protein ACFTE1_21860 [Salininema proteolyticum]|uniref:hypothetical protein n=1 Tax=Salininema proteolyticum TaxID=1607685 RepID=UPI00362FD1D9
MTDNGYRPGQGDPQGGYGWGGGQQPGDTGRSPAGGSASVPNGGASVPPPTGSFRGGASVPPRERPALRKRLRPACGRPRPRQCLCSTGERTPFRQRVRSSRLRAPLR